MMNGAPSILRRPAFEKSNVELVNSLRSNFFHSKQAFAPAMNGDTPSHDIHKQNLDSIPYTQWTSKENEFVFIPSIDFEETGLAEERSQYDITVKLFFLPNTVPSERYKHTQEALNLVLRELHVRSIDLLIVSFPNVSFDNDNDCEDFLTTQKPKDKGEDLDAIMTTWRALEDLYEKGLALKIGLAEFGRDRLEKFLPRTKVRPSVDQISLTDCCTVPASLVQFAKNEKIELLTHNDCTNILPRGTIRELLSNDDQGAGVLVDVDGKGEGLKGDIRPQWVVKYTAVVRDRGVIENKGYFAMAEIHQ